MGGQQLRAVYMNELIQSAAEGEVDISGEMCYAKQRVFETILKCALAEMEALHFRNKLTKLQLLEFHRKDLDEMRMQLSDSNKHTKTLMLNYERMRETYRDEVELIQGKIVPHIKSEVDVLRADVMNLQRDLGSVRKDLEKSETIRDSLERDLKALKGRMGASGASRTLAESLQRTLIGKGDLCIHPPKVLIQQKSRLESIHMPTDSIALMKSEKISNLNHEQIVDSVINKNTNKSHFSDIEIDENIFSSMEVVRLKNEVKRKNKTALLLVELILRSTYTSSGEYCPDPTDPVDKHLGHLINQFRCSVPFIRLSTNRYMVNTEVVEVRQRTDRDCNGNFILDFFLNPHSDFSSGKMSDDSLRFDFERLIHYLSPSKPSRPGD